MEDDLKRLMNNSLYKMFLATLAALSVGCAPSASKLKEMIEKDPSIVFGAIEKNPDKFLEVVNKAAKEAQAKSAQKAQDEETAKREEEFKNPLKPVIDEKRAFYGPADAKITIVEYSDFECPFCSRGFNTIQEVKKAYPGQIRFVFKHLPLDFHPKARPAAEYFEAIAMQSSEKAYKFHDMIFENQDKLKSQGEAFMKEAAKKAGADMAKVAKDIKSEEVKKRIDADIAEAQSFGISGTPGFLINGVSLKGAYPFPEFKTIIDKHLASAK